MTTSSTTTLRTYLATSLLVASMWPGIKIEAQALPPFCEQVSTASLRNIAVPYGLRRQSGRMWCEGILPRPVGIRTIRVVSLKQVQLGEVTPFRPAETRTLAWCDASPAGEAHVALRAIADPLYALDAVSEGRFEWPLSLIARQHRDWSRLHARVTRVMHIGALRDATVWFPVRVAPGASSSTYTFTVRGETLSLRAVLIESVGSQVIVRATDVRPLLSQDQKNAEIPVSFDGVAPGFYRVSFNESASEGNRTTEPIYVYHGRCHA